MPIEPQQPGRRLTPALVAQIRRDIADGRATIHQYVEQLGTRWRTVEAAVYGHSWRSVTDPPPLTPPPPPAEDEPVPSYAKLNVSAVARMRRAYRAGEGTFGSFATEYGVGEATTRNAILGFTWRRVAEPPVRRAREGGWTSLSSDQEQQILDRRLGDHPETYRSIAAALNLDVAVVYRTHQRLTGKRPGISRDARRGRRGGAR